MAGVLRFPFSSLQLMCGCPAGRGHPAVLGAPPAAAGTPGRRKEVLGVIKTNSEQTRLLARLLRAEVEAFFLDKKW